MSRPAPAPSVDRIGRSLDLAGLVLVLLAIAPALGNDLIWDDRFLIEEVDGLGDPAELGSMLSSPFWENSSYLETDLQEYWRPVTTLLLWVGGALFGKWAPGFHALSVGALLAAAVGLYAVARRAFSRPGHRAALYWLSVLFVVHPLASEVVCLTANLADHLVLASLALAVAALGHAYREPGRRALYLPLAGLAAAAAAGSKELGILAALAPLVAVWVEKSADPDISWRLLRRPGPWVSTATPVVIYLVGRHLVTTAAGHGGTTLPEFGRYAEIVFYGLGQALARTLAPLPTGSRTVVETGSAAAVALSILAIGLVAFAVVRLVLTRQKVDMISGGVLVSLGLLLPSLLGAEHHGDAVHIPTRYYHPALAGILLAVSPLAVARWNRRLHVLAVVVAALLTLLSWIRVDEWSDNVSFFAADAVYHPREREAQLNHLRALTNAARYDEAYELLERIEEMPEADEPRFRARLMNDRATLLLAMTGEVNVASNILKDALALDPQNLGNLLDLASMRVVAGRPDEAVVILRMGLDSPYFHDYRREAILDRLRRYEALAREADLDPDEVDWSAAP